jgi:hypothetical protein
MRLPQLLILIAAAMAADTDQPKLDQTCVKFRDEPELSRPSSEAETAALLAESKNNGACISFYTDDIHLYKASDGGYFAHTASFKGLPDTFLAKRTAEGKLTYRSDFNDCGYVIACTFKKVVEKHSSKRPKSKAAEL